jgi:predicted DNA-binding transcriptional regulator AlpA
LRHYLWQEDNMHNPATERRAKPRPLHARLIRLNEVVAMCGLSKASIYDGVKQGTFPEPIKIGCRASAWLKHEVETWIEERIALSRRA